MTLPFDIARCAGRLDPMVIEYTLLDPCVQCQRRTSPGNPHGQWYQGPPEFENGKCPTRISPIPDPT